MFERGEIEIALRSEMPPAARAISAVVVPW
jgi:hypothetical protein